MAKALSPLERAIAEAVHPVERNYCFGRPFELDTTEGIIAQQIAQQNCFRHRWPVLKDPIFTPLFTALFSTTFLGGAASYTLFGGAISLATVATAIATTALSIGLQYALAPKPPKPEDGRAPLMQPIPYRFFGYGQCRGAGALMLWEAINAKLVSVQAVMAHRIESIETFYLHDDAVELGFLDTPGLVIPPDGDAWRYFRSVYIYSRLGAVPETAYSEVVALLGAQSIWTDDHRGDGQASLAMICLSPDYRDFGKVFPNGKPAASIVGRWARCWDFRDPDQDPDDDDTWVWTKNPVVILAHHLCFNPFGEKRDFRRAILPVLDMWQEEADVCDEDVATAAGGSRKRYECSGVDTTEHGPKSATNAILATMDGWTCTRGDGAVLIVAGKYRAKYCATLTDAEIIGYDKQNDVLFDEEVNRFTPKFNYPATHYSTTDTDFFEDIPAQIKAGRPLSEEGHYDWCTEWRQARALGKRDWIRLQQKVRGQLFVNLAGINAAYAPWLRCATTAYAGLNGKVFSNRRATIDLMHGGFQIDVVKMPDNPADIDAFDPETDEGTAPPVPAKPVSDGIPVPIIDSISTQSQTGYIFLRATLIDPSRQDLTPAFHFRLHDAGGGVPGQWSPNQTFPEVEPDDGLLTIDTGAVPGDQEIDYEFWYIGANGQDGSKTTLATITAVIDTTAPDALLSFTATDSSGQFGANFGTENDSHLVTVAIYRVATGAPISPRPTPVARPAVSPGISYAIPVTAPAGTWDIYVEPFNRSNIPGPLSGPDSATVT